MALGRRRTLNVDTYFVKFNPWHTAFMDTIHAAFPKVRCLFIYREPTEMLVSVVKTPAPIMSNIRGTPFAAVLSKLSVEQTQQVSYVEYFAKIYQNFMHAALHSTIPNLKYLNYSHLKAEDLPLILAQSFGYHPAFEELVLMQQQFDYYSKDDKKSIYFSCDKAAKHELITPEVQQAVKQCELDRLYAQLEQTATNLF
ncbi:MAG: hypothetical protein HC925_08005 [Coleofasciculaceae cyanobacterium SM2_3_26]|nr:hypothetical protein [Coleofasciculaceae cyanobacterium SM2_3_26]